MLSNIDLEVKFTEDLIKRLEWAKQTCGTQNEQGYNYSENTETLAIITAISHLKRYQKLLDIIGDATYYQKEYNWLLKLNDDNLSSEVINTNNVQNALLELLKLVDDILNIK